MPTTFDDYLKATLAVLDETAPDLDIALLTDSMMEAHLAAFREASVQAKRPPSRVIVTTADNFRDGRDGRRAMEAEGWTVVM